MILNAWRMATALRREWRRLLPTHAHRTCPLFSLEHAYGCCPHTPPAHAHRSPSNVSNVAPAHAHRTGPPSPSNMPTVAAHTSPILFPAHTGSYPGTMAYCSSHMPTVVRYVAVYLSHLDSNRSHFASPFYLFLSFAPGAIFLGL